MNKKSQTPKKTELSEHEEKNPTDLAKPEEKSPEGVLLHCVLAQFTYISFDTALQDSHGNYSGIWTGENLAMLRKHKDPVSGLMAIRCQHMIKERKKNIAENDYRRKLKEKIDARNEKVVKEWEEDLKFPKHTVCKIAFVVDFDPAVGGEVLMLLSLCLFCHSCVCFVTFV